MGYDFGLDELVGLDLEKAIETQQKEGFVWNPKNEKRDEEGNLETLLTYPGTRDVVFIRSTPNDETRTFKVVEAWATNEYFVF